jgi:hypothetical protein
MHRFIRWLNKRFGTFDLLPEYFTAAASQMQNILWGALLPFVAWGIWFVLGNPPMWVNATAIGLALFLAGYYVWRADHIRLEPKVEIAQVVSDEWIAGGVPEALRRAILWYFPVTNKSDGTTITGVNVQLNQIEPAVDNLDWLPVHLHIKHDNPIRAEDLIRTFDLSPGDTKNVDFVAGLVGDNHFEIRHILPNHINHSVNSGRYRIQVMVTAQNFAPLFKWFEVWIDNNGVLQCRVE